MDKIRIVCVETPALNRNFRWWRVSKWNADILLSQTKTLGKMPGHVSLMFLEDDIPVQDIVKPIVWCICLGE